MMNTYDHTTTTTTSHAPAFDLSAARDAPAFTMPTSVFGGVHPSPFFRSATASTFMCSVCRIGFKGRSELEGHLSTTGHRTVRQGGPSRDVFRGGAAPK